MEANGASVGVTNIIPLALPRGVKKLCELCREEAHLQCSGCQVTFYCDAVHQQADWIGIHERICHLLGPIHDQGAASQPTSSKEIQLKKAELFEICKTVTQCKISEGRLREALPAALFCLHTSADGSVQQLTAYLLLAEAHMGLGNYDEVAELLSKVEWPVLKSLKCDHSLPHQLHRNLGRFHAVSGNLEDAVFHFSNDIYFSSEVYGVDSTVTCQGYFLMADVFARQGKPAIAASFYSKVAQIWHSHLKSLVKDHIQNTKLFPMMSDFLYDKPKQAEVNEMFVTMLKFEQKRSRKASAQTALVTYCLAMLWFLQGDYQQALGFGSTALQTSLMMPKSDLTEPIQSLLQLLRGLQTGPQAASD